MALNLKKTMAILNSFEPILRYFSSRRFQFIHQIRRMPHNRRDFIKRTTLAGSALSLGAIPLGFAPGPNDSTTAPSQQESRQKASAGPEHPLSILILGGTSFLGPHMIDYALGRGHSVTIFTRGRSQPTVLRHLYKDVEHLIGDRNNNLEALKGRTWDVVIDNSGYRVEWTRSSAELLKDSAGLYLYTSSTGVYYPYLGSDNTENTELVLELGPGIPDNEDSQYGIMKSLSEIEAGRAFGEDRTIIVRPTYIIGPGDFSNRFPYWPVRLERGGEVFVPGNGHDPVQFIDVRDLTEFMIRLAEQQNTDTFNVVAPASEMGMHAFVHGAHAATSSAVSWVMIPDYDFLKEQNIPYIVPWIMPVDDNYGSARANNDHAVANGLTFRPLAQTCMDVLSWWYSDAITDERRARLTEGPQSIMAREADIIAAWRSR